MLRINKNAKLDLPLSVYPHTFIDVRSKCVFVFGLQQKDIFDCNFKASRRQFNQSKRESFFYGDRIGQEDFCKLRLATW